MINLGQKKFHHNCSSWSTKNILQGVYKRCNSNCTAQKSGNSCSLILYGRTLDLAGHGHDIPTGYLVTQTTKPLAIVVTMPVSIFNTCHRNQPELFITIAS